ncbi:MAG: type II toxin-antitoxin system VapC family toxin [Chthoniobacterales bacterium]
MLELDANFLVAVLRGDTRATNLAEGWLLRNEDIVMSAIAWSELLCGPLTGEEKERARLIVSRIEPFTADDATLAADLFNKTGRRSRSHADCMIAAAAIRRGSILATLDRPGFERFERFQLRLEVA